MFSPRLINPLAAPTCGLLLAGNVTDGPNGGRRARHLAGLDATPPLADFIRVPCAAF